MDPNNAAPQTGTPAADPAAVTQQPTQVQALGQEPQQTPPAQVVTEPPQGDVTFKTPWSDVQGVYNIGEGEAAKPWYEGIPEEAVREYMRTKNYANPYEAAMAAYNANKMNKLTPDVEAVLSGKGTPEQEATVFKMLGRPDSKDGYELKPGEGVEVDPTYEALAKDIFFEMGLSGPRAQAAYDKWNSKMLEIQAAELEASRNANDAEIQQLSQRWGPELEANRIAGNKAVNALGLSPELIGKVEASIGASAIVELMAAIGKRMGEGKFTGSQGGSDPNDPTNMSPSAAAARINTLRSDSEFQKKFTDPSNPDHKNAVRTMELLYARAG